MKNTAKLINKIICVLISALMASKPVQAEEGKDHTYSTLGGYDWVQISDDTWTKDINKDGRVDITLKTSRDAYGNDVWTYTFNVEDNETAYYVYEGMSKAVFNNTMLANDYTASGSDGKSGVPADPGVVDPTTHTYTITNHKNHTAAPQQQTGGLKITKNVNGEMYDPDQKFTFTITLTGNTSALKNAIKGAQIFGDVPFMDGVGTVTIGNDESAEITDLPAGLNYKIEETVPENYSDPVKTNDTGRITANTTIESEWTNNSTYTPPAERATNSFTLEKKVTGAGKPSADTEYTFHVLLQNLKINTTYNYSINGAEEKTSYKSDDTGIADVAVNLKDNDKALFEDVPVDSTYQIVEAGGEYTPSYAVVDSANKNLIASSSGTGEANEELSTAKETVNANENVTVTFTNNYAAVQNLTVRKYIQDQIDGQTVTTDQSSEAYKSLSPAQQEKMKQEGSKEFEFTVTFTNLPEGSSFSSPVGRVTPDEDGQCIKTFTLKADGTPVAFERIPAGTQYQVEETGSSYIPTYSIRTADMKGNAVDGTINSKNGISNKTALETIEDNESDTVTFVNPVIYNLTIHENVAGNMGDKSHYFKYKITFQNLNAGSEYLMKGLDKTTTLNVFGDQVQTNPERFTALEATVTDNAKGMKATASNTHNGIFTVEFWMKHGQTVTIPDLPAGTRYLVEQEKENYTQDLNAGDQHDTITSGNGLESDQNVIVNNTLMAEIPTGIRSPKFPAILSMIAAGILAWKTLKKNQ